MNLFVGVGRRCKRKKRNNGRIDPAILWINNCV